MLHLKIKKSKAEEVRGKCIQLGILKKDYRIQAKGNFVYIPIARKIKDLGKFIDIKGEREKKRARSIKEVLKKKLTKKEIQEIYTSYDIVGEIAIAEIPENMKKKEKMIADAILEVHPTVKTVVRKHGPVSGKYRTRKVKILKGKKTKETIHKEHGCKFKLNVEDVYYSVRLSGERARIRDLVKPREKILALFAGVGPFPIIIAKKNKKTEIIAIELNPKAVRYMKENIILNKTPNVKAILGDVNKIVPKKYKNWADRVLMPLPMSSGSFLEAAIKGTKNKGMIHFYSFVNSEDPFGEAKRIIEKKCKKCKVKFRILSKKVIRSYSPKIVQVVIDFTII